MESYWFERHPQRAAEIMRLMGMLTPFDEGRCPRCGEVIKPQGVPLSAQHSVAYSAHIGSARCLMQEKLSRRLSNNQARALLMSFLYDPPLCACGCGRKVGYNYRLGRWKKYATRICKVNELKAEKEKNIEAFVNKIRDGETQVELRERLDISESRCRAMLSEAERRGLIRREKTTYRGRVTRKILKIKTTEPPCDRMVILR